MTSTRRARLTKLAGSNTRKSCCTYRRADESCDGAIVMTLKCERCDDTFWVCEAHDDRPSDCCTPDHPRACTCGAPGMPCPDCNARDNPRDQPKMPPGFTIDAD